MSVPTEISPATTWYTSQLYAQLPILMAGSENLRTHILSSFCVKPFSFAGPHALYWPRIVSGGDWLASCRCWLVSLISVHLSDQESCSGAPGRPGDAPQITDNSQISPIIRDTESVKTKFYKRKSSQLHLFNICRVQDPPRPLVADLSMSRWCMSWGSVNCVPIKLFI